MEWFYYCFSFFHSHFFLILPILSYGPQLLSYNQIHNSYFTLFASFRVMFNSCFFKKYGPLICTESQKKKELLKLKQHFRCRAGVNDGSKELCTITSLISVGTLITVGMGIYPMFNKCRHLNKRRHETFSKQHRLYLDLQSKVIYPINFSQNMKLFKIVEKTRSSLILLFWG